MGERHLHEVAFAVHDAVRNHAENVPLLRGVHQADATAGGDALSALDNLQTGEFLIVETAIVEVVIHQDVGPASLEITEVVEFHNGGFLSSAGQRKEGHKRGHAEGQ